MTKLLTIYECGICGCYHPWDFTGDCRDDENRFADPEDYAEKMGVGSYAVDVKSMDERVAADTEIDGLDELEHYFRGEHTVIVRANKFKFEGDEMHGIDAKVKEVLSRINVNYQTKPSLGNMSHRQWADICESIDRENETRYLEALDRLTRNLDVFCNCQNLPESLEDDSTLDRIDEINELSGKIRSLVREIGELL